MSATRTPGTLDPRVERSRQVIRQVALDELGGVGCGRVHDRVGRGANGRRNVDDCRQVMRETHFEACCNDGSRPVEMKRSVEESSA